MKIKKALSESEKKITEHRQRILDMRRPQGLDKMIAKAMPSWIDPNYVDTSIPEYMVKQMERKKKA